MHWNIGRFQVIWWGWQKGNRFWGVPNWMQPPTGNRKIYQFAFGCGPFELRRFSATPSRGEPR